MSDDVVYNCVGNVPTRVDKNTVTFNNESSVAVATKRVVSGQAIGALPKVPAKSGYGGFWTIDGTAIDEMLQEEVFKNDIDENKSKEFLKGLLER